MIPQKGSLREAGYARLLSRARLRPSVPRKSLVDFLQQKLRKCYAESDPVEISSAEQLRAFLNPLEEKVKGDVDMIEEVKVIKAMMMPHLPISQKEWIGMRILWVDRRTDIVGALSFGKIVDVSAGIVSVVYSMLLEEEKFAVKVNLTTQTSAPKGRPLGTLIYGKDWAFQGDRLMAESLKRNFKKASRKSANSSIEFESNVFTDGSRYCRKEHLGEDRWHNRYWHFERLDSDPLRSTYIFVELSDAGAALLAGNSDSAIENARFQSGLTTRDVVDSDRCSGLSALFYRAQGCGCCCCLRLGLHRGSTRWSQWYREIDAGT